MRYTYRKFQKRAKLVGFVTTGKLWLLNIHEEWIHDVYEECHIHYGRIYTNNKAFHPLSTSASGFFQDNETKKWIKVENGLAQLDMNEESNGWVQELDELIRVEQSNEKGEVQHA